MKAAKDAGEVCCDPDRKENILRRNKTRLALWEEHLKDSIAALEKALKCLENSCWMSGPRVVWRYLSPMVGAGFLQSSWEKPIWEGVWPYLNPMDSVCSRAASMEWNVPGKYGPHGQLFFFLIQKEPAMVSGSETFSPFINADIRASSSSPLTSLRSARFSPCT